MPATKQHAATAVTDEQETSSHISVHPLYTPADLEGWDYGPRSHLALHIVDPILWVKSKGGISLQHSDLPLDMMMQTHWLPTRLGRLG
jgi:hypothetical protein